MSIDLAPKVKEGRALYILIPLLLLHLTLLSLQIEDPGGTLLFRRLVLRAEAPFMNLSARASSGIGFVWYNYFWLRGAREENRHLQDMVRQLSSQAHRLQELDRENLRLRTLVALNGSLSFETLAARVVGRAPNYMSNVLYINRGSKDGISVDAPVLSGAGIIGRTILVAEHSAQVQLITNTDASVGVMIDRTRTPGVLKGTGDIRLELNYINNTEQVNVGDLVTTSGLDGIFPKGLNVGRVIESHKGNSVFRAIKVEPYADMVHVEEVLVGLGKPKQEKAGDALPDVK